MANGTNGLLSESARARRKSSNISFHASACSRAVSVSTPSRSKRQAWIASGSPTMSPPKDRSNLWPRMRIPTIDLKDGPAPVADEVGSACEQVGFFTVLGHGVAPELIGEVSRCSRRFFDRPDAEKARFAGPATEVGLPVYRPLGAERLGG